MILYLLLFVCCSAFAENKAELEKSFATEIGCQSKSSPKVSKNLPTLAFFGHQGFAGSLLQTGSECPSLFRIKNQKLSLFDLKRFSSTSFELFYTSVSVEEKKQPAWMNLFYQAILFPEHYHW